MPHIHEKIDFTASVFIVSGDSVLLHKHAKYGKWLQVGGHIELDEDPNEAALREAKEESGLNVVLLGKATKIPDTIGVFRNLILPRFLDRHVADETTGHEHIDFVYFGISATRELNPRPEERSREFHWFTEPDLDDSVYGLLASTRYYAKAALTAVQKELPR